MTETRDEGEVQQKGSVTSYNPTTEISTSFQYRLVFVRPKPIEINLTTVL